MLLTHNFHCSPVQWVQFKGYSGAFYMSKIFAPESQLETIGNEAVYQKHVCTPMFIAALLTVVKVWKQP